jgi:restriction endonuclease S subunit
MVRTANLESELNELTIQLKQIENQTQIVMGYEDSEDQIARLDSSKARIEKELRRRQEELTRLKTNLGT